MTPNEEKRFLRRFRKMIIETKRVTKEAERLNSEAKRCMKRKLRKVM
jgi:hypothetical protein